MPGAALGVAWPSIADEFSRPLGDLGILTLVNGVAYGVATLSTGAITQRWRAGLVLIGAAVAAVASLALFAGAEAFVVMALATVPLGLSGGAVDSIGNGYVAVNHDARAMGAVHAAFGLGSLIAPLVVTAIIGAGESWRIAFLVLAVAELGVGVAFWANRSRLRMPMEGRPERPARMGSTRLLGLSIATFFLYAGFEVSVGFWAYTLLTEGQGMGTTAAGIAVAAHWGALFISRLILGFVGDRIAPNPTIAVSAVMALAGLTLMTLDFSAASVVAGIVLAGFGSGPIFPLEMTLTPRRFGTDYTAWAVGYQLGAATASVAVIPALIGLWVNLSGPLVIGPALVVIAALTLVSVEALRRGSLREVVS